VTGPLDVQAVAPAKLVDPGGQAMQAEAPVIRLNEPAAHGVHDEEPGAEYDPGPHWDPPGGDTGPVPGHPCEPVPNEIVTDMPATAPVPTAHVFDGANVMRCVSTVHAESE